MPKVIRAGIITYPGSMPLDLSQGHCFLPKNPLNGSPDVLVNGSPVVRVTDDYGQNHFCGPPNNNHNMGPAIEGSTTVFANGLGIHGDSHKISCGDVADNGSMDVFIDQNGASNPNPQSETIGYTVWVPEVEYPYYDILIMRRPILFGGHVIDRTFYPNNVPGTNYPDVFPGDMFSPLEEEITLDRYKDRTIPITAEIRPNLPGFLSFDPSTGSLFFNNSGSTAFANGTFTFNVEMSNYVGSNIKQIRLKFHTIGQP